MARYTQTRARVRALADEAAARGEEPSPTAIRRALGTGSYDTIDDELTKWRSERVLPKPLPEPGAATLSLPQDVPQPEGLASLLEPLQQSIEALRQQIIEQDARHAAETARAYDRFTAVQRMAMVAIDEAREQARFWKQEAERAKLEAEIRADTYRDAMRAAQAEAARLAELMRQGSSGPTPAPGSAPETPGPPEIAPLSVGTAPLVRPDKFPSLQPRANTYDLDGFANE